MIIHAKQLRKLICKKNFNEGKEALDVVLESVNGQSVCEKEGVPLLAKGAYSMSNIAFAVRELKDLCQLDSGCFVVEMKCAIQEGVLALLSSDSLIKPK